MSFMKRMFYKYKDKLYYLLVDSNGSIASEYHNYVDNHKKEHYENRWKSWVYLLKLNIKYRIFGNVNEYNKLNKVVNERLPYMNGAESEAFHRVEAHHFAKSLMIYDVISFDIFDTLILRPFDNPTSLFNIVGERLGYVSIFTDFLAIRRLAEKEARDLMQNKTGSREVTLEDIYKVISKKTNIPVEVGVSCEFNAEVDYCFANPYMQRVFNILRSQNKKIIITSDMYIPQDKMIKLLEKCGYAGFDKLYISCDYKMSKQTGELYDIILNDYQGMKIVHIGDNYESDIVQANKKHIDNRFYKSVNNIGNTYRAEWMSNIIGSAYRGIVNSWLHNGTNKFNVYYEYGFICGGLYVFGFCNWLKRKAIEEKCEKIVFLSRDGYIYNKVYKEYFDEGCIDTEYFLWSRQISISNVLSNDFDGFVERIIKQKARKNTSLLESVLSIYCPFITDIQLTEFGLRRDMFISNKTVDRIIKLFEYYWVDIKQYSEHNSNKLKNEFLRLIGNKRKIAVVDVGWTGSGPLSILYLLKKWNIECEVKCFMAGNFDYSNSGTERHYLNGTIESYLFSNFHNRRNQQIHLTTNKSITNNAIFEMLTQALHPSISSYDGVNYVFSIPEVENYPMYKEIQKGILDFCNLYSKRFIKDKWLYNISGFDAYRPYAFYAKKESWLKSIFGDFKYAYGIGNDSINNIINNEKV